MRLLCLIVDASASAWANGTAPSLRLAMMRVGCNDVHGEEPEDDGDHRRRLGENRLRDAQGGRYRSEQETGGL